MDDMGVCTSSASGHYELIYNKRLGFDEQVWVPHPNVAAVAQSVKSAVASSALQTPYESKNESLPPSKSGPIPITSMEHQALLNYWRTNKIVPGDKDVMHKVQEKCGRYPLKKEINFAQGWHFTPQDDMPPSSQSSATAASAAMQSDSTPFSSQSSATAAPAAMQSERMPPSSQSSAKVPQQPTSSSSSSSAPQPASRRKSIGLSNEELQALSRYWRYKLVDGSNLDTLCEVLKKCGRYPLENEIHYVGWEPRFSPQEDRSPSSQSSAKVPQQPTSSFPSMSSAFSSSSSACSNTGPQSKRITNTQYIALNNYWNGNGIEKELRTAIEKSCGRMPLKSEISCTSENGFQFIPEVSFPSTTSAFSFTMSSPSSSPSSTTAAPAAMQSERTSPSTSSAISSTMSSFSSSTSALPSMTRTLPSMTSSSFPSNMPSPKAAHAGVTLASSPSRAGVDLGGEKPQPANNLQDPAVDDGQPQRMTCAKRVENLYSINFARDGLATTVGKVILWFFSIVTLLGLIPLGIWLQPKICDWYHSRKAEVIS